LTPQQETPPPTDSTCDLSETNSSVAVADATVVSEQSEIAESDDSAVAVEVSDVTPDEGGASDGKATQDKEKALSPYGLPCVRELLRFLVSIISSEEG